MAEIFWIRCDLGAIKCNACQSGFEDRAHKERDKLTEQFQAAEYAETNDVFVTSVLYCFDPII